MPPAATPTLPLAQRAFRENFDALTAHWQFIQIDGGTAATGPQARAGFLVFDLPAANQWTAELYAPQRYANVLVEARLDFAAGGQGAAGVICRYDQNTGWYEFNIHPDRTYTLLSARWLAAGVARYTPLVQGESEKIQPDSNEIGLECSGNTLTPYINGTQLRKRQETASVLTSGQIGVSAASFQDLPVSLSFDWVQVSEP